MLRAAIIGMGVGEQHIAGYQADPRCKVVAVCDTDSQKLSELALRYPGIRAEADPHQILSDPDIDVVSIASYDNAHSEQVVAALQHGKHVFVEKPLCQTREQFNDIVCALRAAPQCKLGSNLILRTYDHFITLRQHIMQGDFGQLYYLEGDYDYGRVEKLLQGWRGEIPFYSVVQGGGIHMIDLMMWLTNSRVQSVTAVANKVVTQNTSFRHPDFVMATLYFESGIIGKMTANFGSVTPHCHRLAVYGTTQTYFQNQLGAAYFTGRNEHSVQHSVTNYKTRGHKGLLLNDFVRHLLDEQACQLDSRQALDAMSVALAIEQAMMKGNKVPVNYADIEI